MVEARHLDGVLAMWSEQRARTSCTLEGDCMAPVLRHGDRLVIEHGAARLRTGDVLVVRDRERLIVQRLIAIDRADGALVVAADAAGRPARRVRRESVVGRVVFVDGAHGHLSLDSLPWRLIARALAARSRLVVGGHDRTLLVGRLVAAAYRVRATVPARYSLALLPVAACCALNRCARTLARRLGTSGEGGDHVV